MVDRTTLTVMIESCAPGRLDELAAVLDYDGDRRAHGSGRVDLGEGIVIPEFGVGDELALAEELVRADPSSTFRLWSDPVYEWLCCLIRYDPTAGMFSADCDADGNLVFTERRLRDRADDRPDYPSGARPDVGNGRPGRGPHSDDRPRRYRP